MTASKRKSTVHAMFLWQGFITNGCDCIQWTDEESDLYDGEVGAALWVAEVVDILAETLDAFWWANPEVSFPGVFDYEVSEALGTWLRKEPKTSARHQTVHLKARSLVESFFLRGKEAASDVRNPQQDSHGVIVNRNQCENEPTMKGHKNA